MKVKLLAILLVISGNVMAQQKLKFTYDTAGNQILRDRVCATCAKAQMPSEKDSLETVIAEDALTPEEAMAKLEIIAAPNPVTNFLMVEWTPDAKPFPTSVQLYAMDNRFLGSKNIQSGQYEQELDFSNYAPGLYIVQVVFSDQSRRSFKIIKR